ncbi:hypothetical protein BGZ65_007816 [Modicella reniformis]|uniref:Uncharacterized protein n=1 Tax=Modicella reniformis TaxID=1440133 RepID=A0A9P6LXJ5_9FUNG|nr:hypothetical protein BGZ65_007816 [Modicella reniformis]
MSERFIMCKNLDCTFPFQLPSRMLKKMFRSEKKVKRPLKGDSHISVTRTAAATTTIATTDSVLPDDTPSEASSIITPSRKRQKVLPAIDSASVTTTVSLSVRTVQDDITTRIENTLSSIPPLSPTAVPSVSESRPTLIKDNITTTTTTPEPEIERTLAVEEQLTSTVTSLSEPTLISPPCTTSPTPLLSAAITDDKGLADFLLDDTFSDVWSLPVTPTDNMFTPTTMNGHGKATLTASGTLDVASVALESFLFDDPFDMSSIAGSCPTGLYPDEEFDRFLTQLSDLS